MSHPTNDLYNEDRLANRKDWMAGKETALDEWLENRNHKLEDVMQDSEGMYVNEDGHKMYIDLTAKLEEDYPPEQ